MRGFWVQVPVVPQYFSINSGMNNFISIVFLNSTSLWQFAQSNWHLSNSSLTRSHFLVWGSLDIEKVFLEGSIWWKSNNAGNPLKPHISHLPPLYSWALNFNSNLLLSTKYLFLQESLQKNFSLLGLVCNTFSLQRWYLHFITIFIN